MVSTVASHATDPGSIPGPSIESIFSIYFFFHNIQRLFYFLQQVPMPGRKNSRIADVLSGLGAG
jgi:hypothetical protein